ncbi:MAG: 50S ribosomal protein L6 [Dehalococcoidia bacterium]|nr:50S ribosomal protein L6 [Dehalococcoidia bacterium]HRC62708.1 50S ribosomal protein L6 [Dehalococcoidia bacterium]
MSRVGRLPIPIPAGVEVTLEGQRARVKGPRGQLEHDVHPSIAVSLDEGTVVVTRPSNAPTHRALHGLTRALLANMVTGVSDGFRKSLEIQGTGYRAELRGSNLVLNVGYSHPVELQPLEGAAFEVETPTRVHVVGIDKQVVGQQAALIRKQRPPEPYRGKGIRYAGEVVRRKAGKSGR